MLKFVRILFHKRAQKAKTPVQLFMFLAIDTIQRIGFDGRATVPSRRDRFVGKNYYQAIK